ncbi:gephyrin-like molybdotransferase Glp [Massilia sp. W12]|uniref:molybdopterin molybdotransferase MoeA n=1 Tax=Massilia sp. W12 TaxID=3126507 RepID=UPI0030D009CA
MNPIKETAPSVHSAGRHDVTGLILAGGQARRMGGCDKGLQNFGEHTLVQYVLHRLRMQVGHVALNANRNLDQYEKFGYPVWPDETADFQGPLAGMLAGLQHCRTRFLLCVPCDCPFLPANLVGQLLHGLLDHDADVAVAVSGPGEQTRVHPVFCLMRSHLGPHLRNFLQAGGRKCSDWLNTLKVAHVHFPDAQHFRNINTLDELRAWQPRRKDSAPAAPAPSPTPETTIRPGKAPSVLVLPSAAPIANQNMHYGSLQDYLRKLSDYQPHALPLTTAQRIIRANCRPIAASEQLGLRQALGRYLAQDVVAPYALPAHDNSAMDGFALNNADLSPDNTSCLQVAGRALAGHPYNGKLEKGQCVRIMTGAVLPEGANAVIAHEKVLSIAEAEIVLAAGQLPSGLNCRRRGEELACGDIALLRGTQLLPSQLGLLATLGMAEVLVQRRLRVAFFSTGDELRPLGSPLPPGGLYDSNRYSLYGMLSRLGCDVLDLGIVKDEPEAIRQALQNASLQADAILTSGGMAGGDADHTRRVMQEMGDVHFWQLQMRPGRPFAFGRLQSGSNRVTLFGLPGNPVALMISFYMLVRPALLQMMGARDKPAPRLMLPLAQAVRKQPGRAEFLRARLCYGPDGAASVSAHNAQGSGMLSSMAEADCLLALPPEAGDLAAGQNVPVLMLDSLQ